MTEMNPDKTTHFGYRDVSPDDKTRLVGEVFSSVAGQYDLMNDLMSLGVHRLWKRLAIQQLSPRPGEQALDVAGGTGDLAMALQRRVGAGGRVVIADINAQMLEHGRDRMLDRGITAGIEYVQANAEHLPFRHNSFDLATIAFGLRNVTDKQQALVSMFESLRYGGRLMILEFSHIVLPLLSRLYDHYSFRIIPWLGDKVAGDKDSYVYLVESIRRHPDQKTLGAMLERAGFEQVSWRNLNGGIVAIHTAYKL